MLPGPVTSYKKFRDSNQTIFLLSDIASKKILGFLKTGRKRLFVHDRRGVCVECVPLCVLDFYVHEAHQRKGCGKKLFDFMLKIENIHPSYLAIDLPSKKMIQFLQKHYHLKNPIYSPNNFVIYSGFFDKIFCHSLGMIKQPSTTPSEISPIQIWHTNDLINKRRMNLLVNTNHNHNNNHYDNTVTSEQISLGYQPNPSGYIHYKTLNNQHGNQLPMHIKPYTTNPYTNICNTSKIDLENIKLKQDHNEEKKYGLLDNVNRSTIQKKSNNSIMTDSGMFNYRSFELQNRSKQTYSYINAVRNHNCHTRLW
uniref:N-acetyltransferase domain-containing protein n=2 Tax=Schistosoma mansoni TaxID=6183 RepID=A0A3Q0KS30_SCHMA